MTGFHQDDSGDWVAELECGHNQHVRHRPPFQVREWVIDDQARRARIGSALDCPLCDRAELPASVRHVRDSAVWDSATMPSGLRRTHRLGRATWGVLHVEEGSVRFDDAPLSAGEVRSIPPEVEHRVEPSDDGRFWIEFLTVDRTADNGGASAAGEHDGSADQGGDPACWAGLLCPECGAVMDGNPHKEGCPSGRLGPPGNAHDS
jgi:tellurite resistance-related uncharacterized protein